MVWESIRRLQPFGVLIDFRPRGFQGHLVLHRKLDRMRVGPPHSMRMRKIEMDLGPFPALHFPQRIGFAAELCRHQQIKQRHILEIAAAILGEEVAQDRATRLRVGLHTNEHSAPVRGRHVRFSQQTANGAGIAVIGQPLIDHFLPGVSAPRSCPSAKPGVASARATRAEGDHPPLMRREARAGLHKRFPDHSKIGTDEKARKTGETAQVGA
jgi:hypothetical protein